VALVLHLSFKLKNMLQRFFSDDQQQTGGKPQVNIEKEEVDEKLTLEEEADLTPHELEEMEQKHAQEAYKGSKGSSGPEEKDIAV
jgi:hypothetical protein